MLGTLEVTVIKGEHLPDVALIGQQVPYFKIHVSGQEYKTKAVHGNGKHPVFNELLIAQVANEHHFGIHLWHEHALVGDKEIAHAEVPLNEVIAGGSQERRVKLCGNDGSPAGHVVLLLRFIPYQRPVETVIIEGNKGHASSHHGHHGGGNRVVEEVIVVEGRHGRVEEVLIVEEKKHGHHHH